MLLKSAGNMAEAPLFSTPVKSNKRAREDDYVALSPITIGSSVDDSMTVPRMDMDESFISDGNDDTQFPSFANSESDT